MKTVIEMVKESGGQVWSDKSASLHKSELERFAELVRAEEREACAKVIDEMAEDMVREMEPSSAIAYVRRKAAAIRARGLHENPALRRM